MRTWLQRIGMLRWLAVLLLLAPPAASADSPNPPPDVAGFREGDFWDAGTLNQGFVTYRLTGGKWVAGKLGDPSPNNGQRFLRSFRQAQGNEPFPAVHPDGTFFATSDGRLFGFRNHTWKPIPIGSHLGGRNGFSYTVDVRVTPYEAEQLTQIFSEQGQGSHLSGIEAGQRTSIFPTAAEIADLQDGTANGSGQATGAAWQMGALIAFGVILLGTLAGVWINQWRARRRSAGGI